MLCHQHGFPWPFLATHPYRPLLPAGLHATSRIGTELLYVGSCWLSCLYSSMWRGPQGYITHEFVLISPGVSLMSGSSYFDSFHDEWLVAVQLLLFRVLPPWLVQYCSQHSCVVAVNLFLHTLSVHIVHPYSSIDTTVALEKLLFLLSYLPTPPLGQDMTQGQFF